ncbi:hypothetical protein [Aliarcobacter butzleri]|nr:hypothetical protein [Aliarcobacter butzleri]
MKNLCGIDEAGLYHTNSKIDLQIPFNRLLYTYLRFISHTHF